jgi:hypothetical protein
VAKAPRCLRAPAAPRPISDSVSGSSSSASGSGCRRWAAKSPERLSAGWPTVLPIRSVTSCGTTMCGLRLAGARRRNCNVFTVFCQRLVWNQQLTGRNGKGVTVFRSPETPSRVVDSASECFWGLYNSIACRAWLFEHPTGRHPPAPTLSKFPFSFRHGHRGRGSASPPRPCVSAPNYLVPLLVPARPNPGPGQAQRRNRSSSLKASSELYTMGQTEARSTNDHMRLAIDPLPRTMCG